MTDTLSFIWWRPKYSISVVPKECVAWCCSSPPLAFILKIKYNYTVIKCCLNNTSNHGNTDAKFTKSAKYSLCHIFLMKTLSVTDEINTWGTPEIRSAPAQRFALPQYWDTRGQPTARAQGSALSRRHRIEGSRCFVSASILESFELL